jgi:hypothetical protein
MHATGNRCVIFRMQVATTLRTDRDGHVSKDQPCGCGGVDAHACTQQLNVHALEHPWDYCCLFADRGKVIPYDGGPFTRAICKPYVTGVGSIFGPPQLESLPKQPGSRMAPTADSPVTVLVAQNNGNMLSS